MTDNGSGSLNIANTNTGNATKITGVANGTISANSIEAVNGSQLYALQNNVNNINTLIGGSNSNSTVTDTNGNAATNKNGNATTANEALTTYDAYGTGTASNLTVITAVQNINEQGTKYIHVNGGESSYAGDRGNNVEQSQANGGKSTAIGYKTIANGSSSVSIGNQAQTTADNAVSIGNMTNASTQSVAIGDNAAATGTQAIAIGTGNIVSGSHSGAFGDPNNVTANYAYVVGNNNTVTTENTFILGNNVSVVEENSVALGANTSITAGDSVGTAAKKTDGTAGNTTTAGTTGVVNNTTVNGVSYGGFAGSAAIGAVSVGASGVERRIQNVAAGEISPTSTDAINGSQLYQVASNIGDIHNRIDDLEDNTNAGIAGAIAQGSIPQVTRPGATGIGVGGGYFGGQNALAVGFSALTDSGNWVIKGTISGNTQGKLGVGAGALYQW